MAHFRTRVGSGWNLIICILVGVITNVGIAWLCGFLVWGWTTGSGVACDAWPVSAPPGWPRPNVCYTDTGVGVTVESASAYLRDLWDNRADRAYWISRFSYGVPMRSMESRQRTIVRATLPNYDCPDGVLERGIPLSGSGPRGELRRRLALMPRPLGFVVNTIIYSLLFGVIVYAPRTLKKGLRKRCNRCVNCGYPMSTLTQCPECGMRHIN